MTTRGDRLEEEAGEGERREVRASQGVEAASSCLNPVIGTERETLRREA